MRLLAQWGELQGVAVKIKVELTHPQILWLHEFVGQSPASEMSMSVWEALDRRLLEVEEAIEKFLEEGQ